MKKRHTNNLEANACVVCGGLPTLTHTQGTEINLVYAECPCGRKTHMAEDESSALTAWNEMTGGVGQAWLSKAAPTNKDGEKQLGAVNGSETPRWGMGQAADRKMELMEAVLKHYDLATEHAAEQEGNAEAGEIIREGVEHFMGASVGVAPAQRLMVGVKYCLLALKEWRTHGPEGESQNIH